MGYSLLIEQLNWLKLASKEQPDIYNPVFLQDILTNIKRTAHNKISLIEIIGYETLIIMNDLHDMNQQYKQITNNFWIANHIAINKLRSFIFSFSIIEMITSPKFTEHVMSKIINNANYPNSNLSEEEKAIKTTIQYIENSLYKNHAIKAVLTTNINKLPKLTKLTQEFQSLISQLEVSANQ